ncbi:MAG: GNAT family N-acetyltransferase [Acidobacteria bacterium]|jgi:GNAT superfamily N-acetyltransferase|nr:GNAT family N-acetyltransferase [Acidobacteriota bacterium]
MKYIIEPLSTQHNREDFDSEEPSLNEFLKLYARQNDSKGLGKTFVAVLPDEIRVFGYYTMSSSSLAFDNLPEKLPRYPIPVVHLGRLAVDRTAKGEGLGGFLLLDAFRRSLKVAAELGIYAVEVRALSEQAKNFYLKFGFVELNDDKFHLYLTIKKIRKLAFN